MKNSFGQSVSVTVFGESHGSAVGAVIDGLSPGLTVDKDYIAFQLLRRRPSFETDTQRREMDDFQIISGVFDNKTTGTPICIVIPNENIRSGDYEYGTARPSHADYAAFCKYHGFEDYRGGGHFSGRVTAALVAAGGIILPALESLGIKIGTHILCCGDVYDRSFDKAENDIEQIRSMMFPVLDNDCAKKMKRVILSAKDSHDSVGGITQTAVCGIVPGVGEPLFDSIESTISRAVFAVGGIKGIEFGKGFSFSNVRASECNDEFTFENGKIVTKTNNNGGVNGGISNGMPIVFQCAVKPTPSIEKEQETVNFITKKDEKIIIGGRHDPAIIRRICPVIDSVAAMAVCDLLASRFGTDVFLKGIPVWNTD